MGAQRAEGTALHRGHMPSLRVRDRIARDGITRLAPERRTRACRPTALPEGRGGGLQRTVCPVCPAGMRLTCDGAFSLPTQKLEMP